MDIQPVRTLPIGDDQPWKRDVERMTEEIRAYLVEVESRLAALERRVN